jgi:hypothetical protein
LIFLEIFFRKRKSKIKIYFKYFEYLQIRIKSKKLWKFFQFPSEKNYLEKLRKWGLNKKEIIDFGGEIRINTAIKKIEIKNLIIS